MSLTKVKNCGCKGIRTCLLCEKQSGKYDQRQNEEPKYVYTFCPSCNLCWPDDEDTAARFEHPLYLGKVKLFLDFLSEEEEAASISEIDKIQWMPSQSGRRKQDFGPKVNFKKKKVKVGEFKGFPKFTENILKRLKNITDLSDFRAVELCHLEYSPERGSSIDPHVDDFWLWGERLVTANLGSSTVLTLVPFSENVCECNQESHTYFSEIYACSDLSKKTYCCHKFYENSLVNNSLNHSSLHCNLTGNKDDTGLKGIYNTVTKVCEDSRDDVLSNNDENTLLTSLSSCMIKCDNSEGGVSPVSLENHPYSKSDCLSGNLELKLNKYESSKNSLGCQELDDDTGSESSLKTSAFVNKSTEKKGGVMCSVFRSDVSQCKVAVRVVLPPRSLLVLGGCARYNWFHEIKREDVVSRRLAMTFRELTPEFYEGGKEEKIGEQLLSIAKNFCDFY